VGEVSDESSATRQCRSWYGPQLCPPFRKKRERMGHRL